MREEFKKAFSELSISDKRNELNNEMEKAFTMLSTLKQAVSSPLNEGDSIRNYHIVNDDKLSESEMLDLIYYDFYIIQRNILDLVDKIIFTQKQ
jgi:hypothetical protein